MKYFKEAYPLYISQLSVTAYAHNESIAGMSEQTESNVVIKEKLIVNLEQIHPDEAEMVHRGAIYKEDSPAGVAPSFNSLSLSL